MNELAIKCKWVLAILLFSGCVHQMEVSRQTMHKVDRLATGKSFWLKQSLFMGKFYDDERYKLLHPRAFDELTYVQMPDGETVRPPKTEKVIPVGTRVTILKIEWPDLTNYLNRPLFTPRHLPWMKLKVAMDRGRVSMMRDETFIVVLPISADNTAHFDAWFKGIFSEKDTNSWLLGLDEKTRAAVLAKKVVIGMSEDAMLAALGEPNSLTKEMIDEDGTRITKTIADYQKQIVLLKNGVVTKIQTLTPSTPAQFHSARGNDKG